MREKELHEEYSEVCVYAHPLFPLVEDAQETEEKGPSMSAGLQIIFPCI